ncbi:MAG: hypothetical protein J1F17_04155 [Oscillospiraceae bacterium]|nr:hypothetical protein [Oscillospiraceae bacterium]
MANRFLLKQFAEQAQNTGVYGSYQEGSPQYSTDPNEIQSLPAWLNGWLAATTNGTLLPRLEEMQGLQYVLCKAISENYREGVPEWIAGEQYYKNSIVSYANDTTSLALYYNTTGNYTNNPPTVDTLNWSNMSTLFIDKDYLDTNFLGTNRVTNVALEVQDSSTYQTTTNPYFNNDCVVSGNLVSGFNVNKNVILTKSFPTSQSWQVDLEIMIPSGTDTTTQQVLMAMPTMDNSIGIINNHLYISLNGNVSEGSLAVSSVMGQIYLRLTFDGENYILQSSTNQTLYSLETQVSLSEQPFGGKTITLGWGGSDYLNNFYKGYMYFPVITNEETPYWKYDDVLSLPANLIHFNGKQKLLAPNGRDSYDNLVNENYTQEYGSYMNYTLTNVHSNINPVGALVDNDGVISGFTGQSIYATIPMKSPTTSFEMVIKAHTPTSIANSSTILGYYNNYNGIVIRLGSSGTPLTYMSSNGSTNNLIDNKNWTHAVPANSDVWFKVTWDGSTYELSSSTDGVNYTVGLTVANSNPFYVGSGLNAVGGSNTTSAPFTNGSIDLTQSYVKIDGELFWTGMVGDPTEKTVLLTNTGELMARTNYTESATQPESGNLLDVWFNTEQNQMYQFNSQAPNFTSQNVNVNLGIVSNFGSITLPVNVTSDNIAEPFETDITTGDDIITPQTIALIGGDTSVIYVSDGAIKWDVQLTGYEVGINTGSSDAPNWTQLKYVPASGSDYLANGTTVYTDVACTTSSGTASGSNYQYTGNQSTSKLTMSVPVATNTAYSIRCQLLAGNYTLLVGEKVGEVTAAALMIPLANTLVLGASSNELSAFTGTLDLNQTGFNSWKWNGVSSTAQTWNKFIGTVIGKVTDDGTKITSLTIRNPLQLATKEETSRIIDVMDTKCSKPDYLDYTPLTTTSLYVATEDWWVLWEAYDTVTVQLFINEVEVGYISGTAVAGGWYGNASAMFYVPKGGTVRITKVTRKFGYFSVI